ncbi:hypothetical protein PHYNN_134 [Pantoea phage Phynn]|nr:hypothetical protein PHYNN_134 [Pantoea phage Phynn]
MKNVTAYIDDAEFVRADDFREDETGQKYGKLIGKVRGDTLNRFPDGYEIIAHVNVPFEFSKGAITIQTPSGNRYQVQDPEKDLQKDAIEWNVDYARRNNPDLAK